jgi:sec-independent protein translocase protein TatC
MEPEDHVPEAEVHMTFLEHLGELRDRLLRCLVPILPAFVGAWIYREELFSFLVIPLNKAWISMGLGAPKLHFASPVDPMVVYLKQSAIVAFLATSPWVFYQLWAFVAPGLYAREKRLILPFVFASTVCFTLGGLFGWFFIFPPTFETLMDFSGQLPGGIVEIEPTLMMGEYVSFVTQSSPSSRSRAWSRPSSSLALDAGGSWCLACWRLCSRPRRMRSACCCCSCPWSRSTTWR